VHVLELLVVALGGGIAATGLAAWVGWLRKFEAARLQCISEIELHMGTAKLVLSEQSSEGVTWPRGWLGYRDVLAIGLATRDPTLWDELDTYLSPPAILERGGYALSQEQIAHLGTLRRRLLALAPDWFHGVATYGYAYLGVRRHSERLLRQGEDLPEITAS
jgi:hypothetical protein